MSLFVALLCLFVAKATSSSCLIDNSAKVDCGYEGVNQDLCESAGCCWTEVNDNHTPWCYYQSGSSGGYELIDMAETSYGLVGSLKLLDQDANTVYGTDLTTLTVQVYMQDEDSVRIKITDAAATEPRWEVPQSLLPRPSSSRPAVNFTRTTPTPPRPNHFSFSTAAYEVTYTGNPFTLSVTRLSDSVVVFSSSQQLYFKDQYIEFTTAYDPAAVTYGIGESTRTNHALKTGQTYTLWASDTPAAIFDVNLYSSFPMYVQMLNGKAHGGVMVNSNGMDVSLGTDSITYKMTGGLIDFYVFTGPSPADVLEQYTAVVGRPTLMPYWSLGFHNCKYGYTSLQQVQEVVANYSAAGIPLDTQWVDIDYMQEYRDFTWDSAAFPQAEVKQFVDDLHSNGQRFVTIVDPGIMVVEGYDAYTQGMKEDIFIKDVSGNPYLGQVWPGPTYFPDFTHPAAEGYWTEQLSSFVEGVAVDGIWIDMNEVSNFCNDNGGGQVCENSAPNGCPAPGASQTDCCLVCSTVDSDNKYDYPPYAIGNNKGLLSVKTTAMSATQYGGVQVYDSHNLYGLSEQIATNAALSSIHGKRPFLLTRSAFLGSGTHTAKWTGDNAATWADLKSSIISNMDFNLFGVPMVGADICGFLSDTTEELCARWIEVGAFYPFSRNHNAIGQAPQELYLWPSVAEASRTYLAMRYQLLPYMYSLMYAAHTTGRATVATPLWMNFPEDAHTTSAATDGVQFMVGDAILVSPVLEQGVTSVDAYFPAGLWYSFADYSLAVDATKGGRTVTLDTPLTATNVHVYGGKVLPLQQPAMTTAAGRATPFTLLVALCPGGQAYGSLFWDSGDDLAPSDYLTAEYSVQTGSSSTLTASVSAHGNAVGAFSSLSVGSVVVASSSAQSVPTTVTLAGVDVTSKVTASVDSATNVLTLSLEGVQVPITGDFTLTWA